MVAEKFSMILEKERIWELIPFLKSLEKKDKKEISAMLIRLAKEYLEYRPVTPLIGTTTYKQKASPRQVDILCAVAFVCLNHKDYQKFDRFVNTLSNKIINDILPWYCPDWFSDFVNDLSQRDWIPLNFKYDNAIDLVEKGYLNIADELIVKLLPQIIFEQGADHKFLYVPQNLTKRPITLEKHIWLIFQFESTIHSSDRYLYFQNSTKDQRHWITALKQCSDTGMADRSRLLKESVLATGRNFNKTLTGWFVDLFEILEPTQEELLLLQPYLLNILGSQQSKAINCALKALKKIIDKKQLNTNAFIDHAPILLSSETKSIVSLTLTLFDKILRQDASFKEEICISACQAFIHNDEDIQSKASKLLLKYHDGSSTSITEEVNKYAESMLMTSKQLLTGFLSVTPKQAEDSPPEISGTDNAIPPVKEIKSLDELIFLSSQAFDNNDPLHIDLLPAAMVNLQDQLTGPILPKFEAALQRAYSLIMNDWPSTMGYLDHLLATFFIDLTSMLTDRFPAEGSSLKEIHQSFRNKDAENMAKWSWYNSRILDLRTWSVHSGDTTYMIHKAILLIAYEKVKNADHLPILSTPTHKYGYLDPKVLVSRLALYQSKNVLPDNHDFQLAISRVAPFNHDDALKQARETLKNEILQITEFLFDTTARPKPPYTTPSLWFMAGATKSPQHVYPEFGHLFYATLPQSTFTGDVPWRSFVEHYKTTKYDYAKGRSENVSSKHNVLRLTLNPTALQEPEEKKEGVLSKLADLISTPRKIKREDIFIQHEYISMKTIFISAEHNDIQRLILLFPSNPNPILTLVTHRALVFSTPHSENDKRILTKTLEVLIHLEFRYSEITHLFIASCMLTSDKTVRSFAAEMWMQGVNSGKINNEQTGKIIGIHFSNGYAPMKRFTDLVSSNLVKISPTHNIALEALLTSVIENFSEGPPVGSKRLLELYSEVLSLNGTIVTSLEAKRVLTSWTSSSSLKRVISALPS